MNNSARLFYWLIQSILLFSFSSYSGTQIVCANGLSGRSVFALPQPKIAPLGIEELRQKLKNIQQFVPSHNYHYNLSLWSGGKKIATGTLEGRVNSPTDHPIKLSLKTKAKMILLTTNKFTPEHICEQQPEATTPTLFLVANWLKSIEGTGACVFNMLLPFLEWEDLNIEGNLRKKGRPAYRVRMLPPANIQTTLPELAYIDIILDAYFDALLQAEAYDKNNKLLAAMRVLNFKKLDKENWTIKEVELECNEGGGNKSRLVFEDA